MFDVGFWELCIIGAVLLLVLGPERMPEVVRQIGYWTRRARRTVNDLRAEMKRELDKLPSEDLVQAGKAMKDSVGDLQKEIRGVGSDFRGQVESLSDEVSEVTGRRITDDGKIEGTKGDAAKKEGARHTAGEDSGKESERDTGTARPDSPQSGKDPAEETS